MTDEEERCRNKKRWRTKKAAKYSLNKMSIKKKLQIYRCPVCNEFHLRTKVYKRYERTIHK